ncbi:hypothetical protein DFH08DRAFT_961614 [Mycena albidolilacea]|uniref:Uncharacterized protein n=1 Tax=Mycena albidolilacea TaxID=1033008 RepID=A0AAD6ZZ18_9AGAR|nr:hypothetical protein DFH08DRAFT_961614 [Mycena albidolilacea]
MFALCAPVSQAIVQLWRERRIQNNLATLGRRDSLDIAHVCRMGCQVVHGSPLLWDTYTRRTCRRVLARVVSWDAAVDAAVGQVVEKVTELIISAMPPLPLDVRLHLDFDVSRLPWPSFNPSVIVNLTSLRFRIVDMGRIDSPFPWAIFSFLTLSAVNGFDFHTLPGGHPLWLTDFQHHGLACRPPHLPMLTHLKIADVPFANYAIVTNQLLRACALNAPNGQDNHEEMDPGTARPRYLTFEIDWDSNLAFNPDPDNKEKHFAMYADDVCSREVDEALQNLPRLRKIHFRGRTEIPYEDRPVKGMAEMLPIANEAVSFPEKR